MADGGHLKALSFSSRCCRDEKHVCFILGLEIDLQNLVEELNASQFSFKL